MRSRVVPFETAVRRDSAGRAIQSGSTVDRDANTAVDAQNRRVRVLHVLPNFLRARVGDPLVPLVAFRVSGVDSAGAIIPNVVPLYGPFRSDGVVQPLRDGRWLAAKAGRVAVGVRVMRFAQTASNDTALVRSVTVEVVP